MADNPFPLNQIGQNNQSGPGGAGGGFGPRPQPVRSPAPPRAPAGSPTPVSPLSPAPAPVPRPAPPFPGVISNARPVSNVKPAGAPPPNMPSAPIEPRAGFAPFPGGDVGVRTAASDMRSIQETGGSAPRSYVPTTGSRPPVFKESVPQEAPKTDAIPPFPRSSAGVLPAFGSAAPGPAVAPVGFQSSAASGLSTEFPGVKAVSAGSAKSKNGARILILIAVALLVIAGVGVAGYFFVFPLFFDNNVSKNGSTSANVSPEPYTPPVIPSAEPVSGGLDDGIVVENGAAVHGGTTVAGILEGAAPVSNHVSLLLKPADSVQEVVMPALDYDYFKSLIPFSPSPAPTLKEVAVKDSDGKSVRLAQFGTMFGLKVFSDLPVAGTLEDDFTLLVYEDDKGSWPVYLMRVPADVGLADAAAAFRAGFEGANVTGRSKIFLTDSGSIGVWKDGLTDGVSGRYAVFSGIAGAALNYGWKGNVLVVGTSYNAYRETLKRL